jgi:hypothetical protein
MMIFYSMSKKMRNHKNVDGYFSTVGCPGQNTLYMHIGVTNLYCDHLQVCRGNSLILCLQGFSPADFLILCPQRITRSIRYASLRHGCHQVPAFEGFKLGAIIHTLIWKSS